MSTVQFYDRRYASVVLHESGGSRSSCCYTATSALLSLLIYDDASALLTLYTAAAQLPYTTTATALQIHHICAGSVCAS
jgi:hypothetical protein